MSWSIFLRSSGQGQTHVQISELSEHKIVIIFLPINLNTCFGCSKEPSYRDGSFEYPQHMFLLRNKKNMFNYTHLSWSGWSRALTPLFGNGAGAHGIGKISGVLTKIGKYDIVLMYDISIARLLLITKLNFFMIYM